MDGLDERWRAWVGSVAAPVTAVRPLPGGTTSTVLALTTASGPVLVLRVIDREPWRTHGAALAGRERVVQQSLAGSPVPVPRSVALDAEGSVTGEAAHLMTLLPGSPTDQAGPAVLDGLAALLADVHALPAAYGPRTYESWAWKAKHVVPTWARDRGLWEAAFALFRTEPPTYEPTFLHRDFALRNVLWTDGRVSGLVDWVEASVGPAWLDVAHCCTDLALDHGGPAADAFASAYVERTGRRAQPWFAVMDVVGFLPVPGRAGSLDDDPVRQVRLEERLRVAVAAG